MFMSIKNCNVHKYFVSVSACALMASLGLAQAQIAPADETTEQTVERLAREQGFIVEPEPMSEPILPDDDVPAQAGSPTDPVDSRAPMIPTDNSDLDAINDVLLRSQVFCGQCQTLKCPEFSCAQARELYQNLVQMEYLIERLQHWSKIGSDATFADYMLWAEKSKQTGENISDQQAIILYQDTLMRFGGALLDTANVIDAVKSIKDKVFDEGFDPRKLGDYIVVADTALEGLKDLESGINELSTMSTGEGLETKFITDWSSAETGLMPGDNINTYKSDVSNVAGYVDALKELQSEYLKFGKDSDQYKKALKNFRGVSLNVGLNIVARHLRDWGNESLNEQKAILKEYQSLFETEQNMQTSKFENWQPFSRREEAAALLLPKIKAALDQLEACLGKECGGAPTVSIQEMPDFSRPDAQILGYGQSLRWLNREIDRLSPKLQVPDITNACPPQADLILGDDKEDFLADADFEEEAEIDDDYEEAWVPRIRGWVGAGQGNISDRGDISAGTEIFGPEEEAPIVSAVVDEVSLVFVGVEVAAPKLSGPDFLAGLFQDVRFTGDVRVMEGDENGARDIDSGGTTDIGLVYADIFDTSSSSTSTGVFFGNSFDIDTTAEADLERLDLALGVFGKLGSTLNIDGDATAGLQFKYTKDEVKSSSSAEVDVAALFGAGTTASVQTNDLETDRESYGINVHAAYEHDLNSFNLGSVKVDAGFTVGANAGVEYYDSQGAFNQLTTGDAGVVGSGEASVAFDDAFDDSGFGVHGGVFAEIGLDFYPEVRDDLGIGVWAGVAYEDLGGGYPVYDQAFSPLGQPSGWDTERVDMTTTYIRIGLEF